MAQSILRAAVAMRSFHAPHRPIIAPSRLFSTAPMSRRQFPDVVDMDSSQEPHFSPESHISQESQFSPEPQLSHEPNFSHEPRLMIDQSALSPYTNNYTKKERGEKKKLSVEQDHQDGSEKSDFHAYDGIPTTLPMSKSEYYARIHSIKMKEGQRIGDELREMRILGRVLGSFVLILVGAFASDRTVRDTYGNIIATLNPASYWWHWCRGAKYLERRASEEAASVKTEMEKTREHYSKWMWASKS